MDRYIIREAIGDGSFGTVYRARNKTTHEEVLYASFLATSDGHDSTFSKNRVDSRQSIIVLAVL